MIVKKIVQNPCPDCGSELSDVIDRTYSNVKTHRAKFGDHTGDIYYCFKCEVKWIDDFLNNEFRRLYR